MPIRPPHDINMEVAVHLHDMGLAHAQPHGRMAVLAADSGRLLAFSANWASQQAVLEALAEGLRRATARRDCPPG